MNTTINISLPKGLYDDAKRFLAIKRYSSISELIRDSLRRTLYPEITENGFTREFEDSVLAAEAEAEDKNRVWRTEDDIRQYFKKLRRRINKNDKSQANGRV